MTNTNTYKWGALMFFVGIAIGIAIGHYFSPRQIEKQILVAPEITVPGQRYPLSEEVSRQLALGSLRSKMNINEDEVVILEELSEKQNRYYVLRHKKTGVKYLITIDKKALVTIEEGSKPRNR